jgi:hypothetical protein
MAPERGPVTRDEADNLTTFNQEAHEMWKVSYLHYANGDAYRVSRRFDSKEAAQEFIDNNALVYPLPGVELHEVGGTQ